jgi:transitional endoplasmic reticulum ATPase
MIELPLRHPEIFEKLGTRIPKSILFRGPTGTGKTHLARAVASVSSVHFIPIAATEIISKYHGEAEAKLREIFKEAKEKAPSIIFIDEIDSIAPIRKISSEAERKLSSQLLSLMDGLESRGTVFVIAATNRHEAVDPAFRRPGRFDVEIEFRIPDQNARLEILKIYAGRIRELGADVDLEKIASMTEGFTGADLEYLCTDASMNCIKRMLQIDALYSTPDPISNEELKKLEVNMSDFEAAADSLSKTKKAIPRE